MSITYTSKLCSKEKDGSGDVGRIQAGFVEKSLLSQIMVRKQMMNFKMKESDTVNSNFLVFENIVRHLRIYGVKIDLLVYKNLGKGP